MNFRLGWRECVSVLIHSRYDSGDMRKMSVIRLLSLIKTLASQKYLNVMMIPGGL